MEHGPGQLHLTVVSLSSHMPPRWSNISRDSRHHIEPTVSTTEINVHVPSGPSASLVFLNRQRTSRQLILSPRAGRRVNRAFPADHVAATRPVWRYIRRWRPAKRTRGRSGARFGPSWGRSPSPQAMSRGGPNLLPDLGCPEGSDGQCRQGTRSKITISPFFSRVDCPVCPVSWTWSTGGWLPMAYEILSSHACIVKQQREGRHLKWCLSASLFLVGVWKISLADMLNTNSASGIWKQECSLRATWVI